MVLLSVVVNGILLGLIYALFAVGLTISLGVMRVFNVAYGALVTFAVIQIVEYFPTDPFAVIVVVGIVAGAVLGLGIELVAVTPLQRRSVTAEQRPEATLLTTLAVWLILSGTNALQTNNGQYQSFPPNPLSRSFELIGLHLQYAYVVGAGLAVVLVVLTWAIVMRTQIGRSLRAIAENVQVAQLVGISVRRYSMGSAAFGGALAGLAGVVLATILVTVDTGFGDQFLLRGFEIVVVAGIGSILGSLFGGLILGLTETLVAYFGGGAWTTLGGALVVAIVIIIRPNGLFGRREINRA
jgi:branched-chain amino acid transport system permease protein